MGKSTVHHKQITVRKRAHAANLQRPTASITAGYNPINPKITRPALSNKTVMRNDTTFVAGKKLPAFPAKNIDNLSGFPINILQTCISSSGRRKCFFQSRYRNDVTITDFLKTVLYSKQYAIKLIKN